MSVAALVVTFAHLLLAGLMAGTFFTWSNAVLAGLDRLQPAAAIRAFRAMDAAILNRVFLVAFVAPTLTGPVAGVLWLLEGRLGAAVSLFVATAAHVCCQTITGIVNVPMNNRLREVEIPTDPAAAAKLWTDFSARWVRWNSLRTLVCLVGLAAAGLALYPV